MRPYLEALRIGAGFVSVLLIAALGASVVVQPATVIPADAPERLLPFWTEAPEVTPVQGSCDAPAPALERSPVPVPCHRLEPVPRWLRVELAGTVDPAWREHFLVSRRNTKYKERQSPVDGR